MAEEFSITDWLAKAKEDPKVAAQPLIIAVAVLFGGYKALYSPKVIELAKEEKKVKSIETNIKKVKSAVENIEDIKLDIEDKKEKVTKAKSQLYRKSEMTKFLRRVRELATKAGIEIKSVNPQPIAPVNLGNITAEKLPVSFSFDGDMKKLGIFLRLIEKEEKLTFINLPNLTPNASGTFDIDLVPTTLLIPDDA